MIVIIVMDLGLLYSDFVMDNQELILHTAPGGSVVFRDDTGSTICAITAFRNEDPDIERDPLSTNRRLFDSGGIELFGTMVVAGPHDGRHLRTSPGLDHLHSGRDISTGPTTCDWTEVGSG